MSIANEHADNFYFPHFEFKDSVNATYIMVFWDQTPCILHNQSGSEIHSQPLDLLARYPEKAA